MLRPWVETGRLAPPSIYAAMPDEDLMPPILPREHPPWVKDALAVSARARQLFAKLRAVTIPRFGFWDHRLGGIQIAGRQLLVDSSGSYYAVQ